MRAIAIRPEPVQSRDVRDYAGAVVFHQVYRAGPQGAVVGYRTHSELRTDELRDILTAILNDLGGTL